MRYEILCIMTLCIMRISPIPQPRDDAVWYGILQFKYQNRIVAYAASGSQQRVEFIKILLRPRIIW